MNKAFLKAILMSCSHLFLSIIKMSKNFLMLLFDDAPFRPKIKFKGPTRFSDGSFPVFYSSLDADTAHAEVKYWLTKSIGQARETRKVYLWQFSCTFRGQEKDIRPKAKDWPGLTSDNDYTFCNQIGAEAKKLELDGIVTVSVRRRCGDNLPIFSRNAIRNPELESLLAMTFDPETNQIITEKQISNS